MIIERDRILTRGWKNLFYVTFVMILTMVSGNNILQTISTTESSAEYLKHVMIELQGLNLPLNVKNTHPYPMSANNHFDVQNSHTFDEDYYSNGVNLVPRKKIDRHQQVNPYYQVHPNGINNSGFYETSLLGVSRKQLADMYQKALVQGSAVSLASLTNAILPGRTPYVTNTHLEIPVAKPAYTYYFYPLKTFQSELYKDNGYRTIPATGEPLHATATGESQKQLASPMFMALTTFAGMTILFMLWVLFVPKFNQFKEYKERSIHDEVLHLTRIVLNTTERCCPTEAMINGH